METLEKLAKSSSTENSSSSETRAYTSYEGLTLERSDVYVADGPTGKLYWM